MLSILHVTPKSAHILCPITLQGIHFWIAHTLQLQFPIKYGLPQVEPRRVVGSIPSFLFSLEVLLLPLRAPQGRCAFRKRSLPGEGEKYFSPESSGRESGSGIWLTDCLSPSVGARDDLHLQGYADGTRREGCQKPSWRLTASYRLFPSAALASAGVSVRHRHGGFISCGQHTLKHLCWNTI